MKYTAEHHTDTADHTVKDTRRKTRKRYSSEEKDTDRVGRVTRRRHNYGTVPPKRHCQSQYYY